MRNRRNRTRRRIANLLFTAGIIALGIWAWSQVRGAVYQSWAEWSFDRKTRGQTATVGEFLAAKKDQIFRELKEQLGPRESAGTAVPAPPAAPTVPAPAPPVTAPATIHEGDLLGRLEIPRLHLRAMVREGDSAGTLGVALGHIPGTALPGANGNVGIAGHRDTLFRKLREVGKKDVIEFHTLGGSYSYQVESTQIVQPDDVAVLKASEQPEITLVTCYPFDYIGSAPDRFIVKARLITPAGSPEKVPAVTEAAAVLPNAPVPKTPLPGDTPVPADPSVPAGVPISRKAAAPAAAPAPVSKSRKPKLADNRVTFQVSLRHSRELAPGISMGVSDIDANRHRVNGWMWLMPDRRTIWLRNRGTNDPIVFYGFEDGKRRELVLTSVTRNSVTGYVRLSGQAALSASWYRRR